jgi:hypothetical protein
MRPVHCPIFVPCAIGAPATPRRCPRRGLLPVNRKLIIGHEARGSQLSFHCNRPLLPTCSSASALPKAVLRAGNVGQKQSVRVTTSPPGDRQTRETQAY